MTLFKRTRKGIKVCRIVGDSYYESAFHDGKVINYHFGEWNERPEECGPLAVFKKIEYAINFLKNNYRFDKMLFECKYIKSKEKDFYFTHYSYKDDKKQKISMEECRIPKGTRFADKVKLIKRVE